jgi:hypothetical protein
LEAIEFAPLKRFTDLATKNLLNASALHNKALEEILSAMFKELPSAPVKSLKKLLEIYIEIIRLNHSRVQDDTLKARLSHWKESTTFAKTTKALET